MASSVQRWHHRQSWGRRPQSCHMFHAASHELVGSRWCCHHSFLLRPVSSQSSRFWGKQACLCYLPHDTQSNMTTSEQEASTLTYCDTMMWLDLKKILCGTNRQASVTSLDTQFELNRSEQGLAQFWLSGMQFTEECATNKLFYFSTFYHYFLLLL